MAEIWGYPSETEVTGVEAYDENVCTGGMQKSDPLVRDYILLPDGNFTLLSRRTKTAGWRGRLHVSGRGKGRENRGLSEEL